MDELILKALRGSIDPDDKKRLDVWRSESSENEKHYQDVARIWQGTEPKSKASRPSANAIISAANKRQDSRRDIRIYSARRAWTGQLIKLAAMLAVLIGISFVVLQTNDETYLNSYSASGPGTETITLDDGTIVRLASGSVLHQERSFNSRSFRLDGVAFFAVRHDPNRPFLVSTDGGGVEVLGTRFEVGTTHKGFEVGVRDGLVAVHAASDTVQISTGQKAVVENGLPPVVSASNNADGLQAWPNGILLFRDTRLDIVVEELSAHFDRYVIVSDSSLSTVPVTAWFDGEPLEETVETVCLITGAVCEVFPSQIIISPKPSER